jgi:hypothetical protein
VSDAPGRANLEESSFGLSRPTDGKPYLAHLGRDGNAQLLTDHLRQVSKLSGHQGAKLPLLGAAAARAPLPLYRVAPAELVLQPLAQIDLAR